MAQVNTEPDVLVVGAGPVGMSAALTLARRNVKTLLLDDGCRTTSHHGYAVGLHPTSLDLLARLGLGAALAARGHRVDGVFLYADGAQHGWTSLAGLGSDHAHVLALPQITLEEELEAALGAAGRRVQWSHRLKALRGGKTPVAEIERLERVGGAGGPELWTVAERLTVRPRFVIGADGHNSLVRRSLGIELQQQGAAHRYLAAEVAPRTGDAGRDLRVLLRDEQVDAVWPLPGGRHRCSLQLAPEAEQERRFQERALWAPHPDGGPAELLAARVPWLGGPVVWSGVARFERRLTRSYGADAVWLAGDAAHTTSPLGVQSLNMGLREGVTLASAIADALDGDRRALELYEPGFRAEWALLHGAVPLLAEDPWMQQAAPRLLGALPATGAPLRELLRRLGVRTAQPAVPGILVDPAGPSRTVRAS